VKTASKPAATDRDRARQALSFIGAGDRQQNSRSLAGAPAGGIMLRRLGVEIPDQTLCGLDAANRRSCSILSMLD